MILVAFSNLNYDSKWFYRSGTCWLQFADEETEGEASATTVLSLVLNKKVHFASLHLSGAECEGPADYTL